MVEFKLRKVVTLVSLKCVSHPNASKRFEPSTKGYTLIQHTVENRRNILNAALNTMNS